MSRPAHAPGTWGRINVTRISKDSYEALARYTFFSGEKKKVTARASSESGAEQALIVKMQGLGRTFGMGAEITSASTIAELAEFWLAEKESEGLSANSLRSLRGLVNNHIVPSLGQRTIGQTRTSAIDAYLKAHQHKGNPTKVKGALNGMFGLAARHEAVLGNPVTNVARLKHTKRPVQVLDDVGLFEVRALAKAYLETKRPGPKTSNDILDICDLLLGTGCRIGECLAFTDDVMDLASPKPTITVSGTVVTETGKGTFRQPWTKTHASYRTLYLPPFAVEILLRRQVEGRANPMGAVFTTRNSTWYQVANMETLWSKIVKGSPYEWVTFHIFRKTVATLIDDKVGLREASLQLGHVLEETTETHYIHKPSLAADVSTVLEAFRPG